LVGVVLFVYISFLRERKPVWGVNSIILIKLFVFMGIVWLLAKSVIKGWWI
jgi:hypothetical protein